jgi:hypothetical protein
MGLGLLPATGGEVSALPVLSGMALGANGAGAGWDAGYGMTTPGLYLVDPANLDSYTTVLDDTWHVRDVAVRPRKRPGFSAPPAGAAWGRARSSLPRADPARCPALSAGPRGPVEEPALSADGRVAAGLRASRYGDFGLEGRLVVIHLENGERFAVETPGDVWGLTWGGAQ